MSDSRELGIAVAAETALSGAFVAAHNVIDSQSCRTLPSPHRTCSSLSTIITTKAAEGILPEGGQDNVQEDSIRFPDDFQGESNKLSRRGELRGGTIQADEVHSTPPAYPSSMAAALPPPQSKQGSVSIAEQQGVLMFSNNLPAIGSTRSQMSDNVGLISLQGEEMDSSKYANATTTIPIPTALAEVGQNTLQQDQQGTATYHEDENPQTNIASGEVPQQEAQCVITPYGPFSMLHSGRSLEVQKQGLDVAVVPQFQDNQAVCNNIPHNSQPNMVGVVPVQPAHAQENVDMDMQMAVAGEIGVRTEQEEPSVRKGEEVATRVNSQQKQNSTKVHNDKIEVLSEAAVGRPSKVLRVRGVGIVGENGQPQFELTVKSDQNNGGQRNQHLRIKRWLIQHGNKPAVSAPEADSDKDHSHIAVAEESQGLQEQKSECVGSLGVEGTQSDDGEKPFENSRAALIKNMQLVTGQDYVGEEYDSMGMQGGEQSIQQGGSLLPERHDYFELNDNTTKRFIEQQSRMINILQPVDDRTPPKECCSVEAQANGEFDLNPQQMRIYSSQAIADEGIGSPEIMQHSVSSQVDNHDRKHVVVEAVPATVAMSHREISNANENDNENDNGVNNPLNQDHNQSDPQASKYEPLARNLQTILSAPDVPNSITANILNIVRELSRDNLKPSVVSQVALAFQVLATSIENMYLYQNIQFKNGQYVVKGGQFGVGDNRANVGFPPNLTNLTQLTLGQSFRQSSLGGLGSVFLQGREPNLSFVQGSQFFGGMQRVQEQFQQLYSLAQSPACQIPKSKQERDKDDQEKNQTLTNCRKRGRQSIEEGVLVDQEKDDKTQQQQSQQQLQQQSVSDSQRQIGRNPSAQDHRKGRSRLRGAKHPRKSH